MTVARFVLRLCVGGFFVGHGTQKLFGWFGGPGLEATGEGFEQLGLRPGRVNAAAAGVCEAGGGVLILTGLATPLATAALTGTMLTAIDRVHSSKGPWSSNGGYEYNVVLIAALLTLVEAGPGSLSLGEALGIERSGKRWALAAFAGGMAGAVGVRLLTTAERAQAPQRSEPEYQQAAA